MDWTQRINDMAWGYKNAAILLNSLRAGIFEAIGDRLQTPQEVATTCELDARATDIVMHALAAMGILKKDGARFALEPGAQAVLLADSPTTQKNILGHNLFMMRGWANLDTVLKTGQPAPGEKSSKQQMQDFICGMENVSRLSSLEVAEKIDLSSAQRLLDLGGGPGTAAIALAQANRDLRCVVFDLEGPIGIAQEKIAAAGLQDRVTTVAGNFHTDDYGSGFDVVYIANIIHMMAPAKTLELFKKSRAALVPEGRLLLKDFFLEDSRTEPATCAQFSVNMLVNTQDGRTYTRSETLNLLEEAGFGGFETIDIATHSQVIVGHPSEK